MNAYRLRLAQLALENLPFPRHQTRTVLDLYAADGATTQYLQYFLPYSTVFGVTTESPRRALAACGQRYLAALPNGFQCDCVVAFVEPSQPIEATLEQVRGIAAHWELILAPWQTAQAVDWQSLGYQAHNEITEEPNDGVIVVAVRNRKAQQQANATPRVLIASPVRQKPAILRHFLGGLQRLDTTGLEVAYLFVDNNDDPQASQMLRAFAEQASAPVHRLRVPVAEPYQRTEVTHHWTESLIWRLAAIKDGILHAALQHGYDYAFLVDSDLVLHPQTLRRMVGCRRDILSQVFWTVWSHDQPPLPNIWYTDQYTLYRARREQVLNDAAKGQRIEAFLNALAFSAGIYRVSGLGACTLISRRAIEAGVNFSELRGCLLWGEDRHLCLRAEALGFHLFADTTLPPLHLYRESELPRVEAYWKLVEAGIQGAELNRAMFELLGRVLQVA